MTPLAACWNVPTLFAARLEHLGDIGLPDGSFAPLPYGPGNGTDRPIDGGDRH